ncbi:MAG: phage tail sheath family protein [Ferruginibacter sp.]|nr:phage tail sheath family protein [Ferruginibacter sp.]
MATNQTPGIYIEEENAFPNSAVAVATAIPVFIGYTQKAEHKGISLIGKPIYITSFAEYMQWFGHGYHHRFAIKNAPAIINQFQPDMVIQPATIFYLYNCMRLFYLNGGGSCYILSVGTYGEGANKITEVNPADLSDAVFDTLEKTPEPTLVVLPDFVNDRDQCYHLYKKVLAHCANTQSRFGIFDVIPDAADASTNATLTAFREAIGTEALNYGAAYYPWLNASVVAADEVDFTNMDVSTEALKTMLPETDVSAAIDDWNNAVAASPTSTQNRILHQALMACSNTYVQLVNEIKNRLNLLPPSCAIAGIYSLVDGTRGVWKAPANVSISMAVSPAVNISAEEQQDMNIDVSSGKSVNAIRPFPGQGCLVWGARTLDGNSQDWRYINVRRTMIMIEQSLKLACRAYVFEPNVAATWVTMKSMMNNFLNSLWQQGALAGASPEQAFDVQTGLGATMTPQDILDGVLLVTVKLALVRPAEFIVLTIQQQQQRS